MTRSETGKSTVKKSEGASITRREAVKRAAYVVPAVLTLAVTPSFAGQASCPGGEDGYRPLRC